MLKKEANRLLEILKRSPFILEKLYHYMNSDYRRRYNYGTITDEEVQLIKEWLK